MWHRVYVDDVRKCSASLPALRAVRGSGKRITAPRGAPATWSGRRTEARMRSCARDSTGPRETSHMVAHVWASGSM